MWLLIGCLILLLAWDYRRKRCQNKTFKKSRISGPPLIPIFGNVLQLMFLNPENMLQFFGNQFNKYGDSFRLWALGECAIYTKDIKIFEALLSSNTLLEKAQLYRFVRHFLGDGILLSTGRKWNTRRKAIAPAFHFKCLENFVEIMDKHSGVMVEKLREVADGKTSVNVFKYISKEALDVITETAMGVQVNAQHNADFPYTRALKSVVYIESNRMASFLQRFDWLFPLATPRVYRRLKNDIRTMQEFTDQVIRERRSVLERSKADGTYQPLFLGDEDTGHKSKISLIDILLQATIDDKPLSDVDIREEVDTFVFAGTDTTTSAVSHALHVISRYPKVQDLIYKELIDVLGQDPNAPVTQSQLLSLKYLDCVIKEAMRLHPPVPLIGRHIPKDLQIGEKTIPGDTDIMLVSYFVFRDPEYFPDPLTFKPERWLNEEKVTHPKIAYIPYSAGPKNCIGQKYAILQMKTLISKVIRHYELLPMGGELNPTYTFILSSSTGNHLGLKPRIMLGSNSN
ncbi:LOW QUALITY PROTEIN: probable cytochrome P450 4d21 [Drosophila ficusphila]|uniref:LOW QUALITY PROTEIN: probable cytochrome P450 4d21 n=1 Tax=Drosophila ficusphila TaxID=30025 RepID=UPI001C890CAA|nr:LOW QUALITY PROTEIN: probable cytochrome P450 4d21 [Drosophila ficusphila]